MSDKIRPSKVVMTHGPGAIIDLKRGKSGIVMSPDYWKKYEIIRDIRLASYLNVKHFRSPKSGFKETETGKYPVGVQIRPFPRRWYCGNKECRSLQNKSWGACTNCGSKDLVVPRIIAACEGGHVQDFPWEYWIGCECGKESKIKFPIQPGIESGSDILITCDKCKKRRDLRGALGSGLKAKCFGSRPWIGDREANQSCKRPAQGVMRGSSNTYFSINVPSILIPPYASRIYTEIMEESHISYAENLAMSSGGDSALVSQFLENFIDSTYRTYIENGQYTKQDFLQAFERAINPSQVNDLKIDEWQIFNDPAETNLRKENPDFSATINGDLNGDPLEKYFEKIVLVKSLTEVIALTGFTRIKTPSPKLEFSDKELEDPAKTNIREENNQKWELIEDEMLERWRLPESPQYDRKQEIKSRKNWLPAVKNKGEGIFLVLNKSRLENWESTPFWKEQISQLSKNVNYITKPDGFDESLPRSLLLHTFAHLLSIEISKECGYQLASIKERLYCTKDMYGILLYTSAADSQGSLGGLVTQAQDLDLLRNHIRNMRESAHICSQDPLCSEHNPESTGKPWGASCHSCTNVPETSCERLMNQFLDRHTITGNKGEKVGYFD